MRLLPLAFVLISSFILHPSSFVSAYPSHLIAITDIDPSVFDRDFNDDKDDEKGESGYHFSRMVNLSKNLDIAMAEPVSSKKTSPKNSYSQKHYRFLTELWHNQTWYKLSSSEGIRWHSVGAGKTPKTD